MEAYRSHVYKPSLNAPTGATTRDFPSNLDGGAAHDIQPFRPLTPNSLSRWPVTGNHLNRFQCMYIHWNGLGVATTCTAEAQNKKNVQVKHKSASCREERQRWHVWKIKTDGFSSRVYAIACRQRDWRVGTAGESLRRHDNGALSRRETSCYSNNRSRLKFANC